MVARRAAGEREAPRLPRVVPCTRLRTAFPASTAADAADLAAVVALLLALVAARLAWLALLSADLRWRVAAAFFAAADRSEWVRLCPLLRCVVRRCAIDTSFPARSPLGGTRTHPRETERSARAPFAPETPG
jgi:hypothetical protein